MATPNFDQALGRKLRWLTASALAFPAVAHADCTANGQVVTCTGSSTGYSNVSSGVSLTADSTAAITGPLLLGSSATVLNGGSLTSSTTAPLLQVGTTSLVTNNGTISLTSSTGGSAALALGDNSTLINNGALSAIAGTPLVQFGQAGTFINNSSATAAVTGNILFSPNVSGGTSTLNNYNSAFGITSNISSVGNTSIYNSGLINGSFVETPTGASVAILNDTAGKYTGSISTGDTTSLVNNGNLILSTATSLGRARLGTSTLTNSGTLSVGSAASTELVVNGSFANTPTGIINIALHTNGASAPVAGTSFSQIYAAGPTGTATLGGTLNLVPSAGFYPTGSTYDVILADQSIGGSFATVNGSALPFISFVPVGIVSIGTQQAYEVMAVRTSSYSQAIASVATPSQLIIAKALDPLVAAANADPTSAAATLVGSIDLLTIPQTQTLLDQINPANYGAFRQALADQMNVLNRAVLPRALDETGDSYSTGWWINPTMQFHVGSRPSVGSRENLLGATGGFDTSGKAWRAGVVLGVSSATLRTRTGPGGTNNAYMFGGYASVHAGPAFLVGQAVYDLGNLSASKNLSLAYTTTTTAATSTAAATTTTTASNTSVSAKANEHLLKLSAMVGFNLPVGPAVVTPMGGIDYARGAINSFTETGGQAADLTVGRISANRTDMLAGLNVTAKEGQFRPYVRAIYRSRLGGSADPLVTAYFNGDPTTSFSLAAPSVAHHEADIDAGLNLVYDDGAMFVGYTGTIRKGMTVHGIQAGLRLMF